MVEHTSKLKLVATSEGIAEADARLSSLRDTAKATREETDKLADAYNKLNSAIGGGAAPQINQVNDALQKQAKAQADLTRAHQQASAAVGQNAQANQELAAQASAANEQVIEHRKSLGAVIGDISIATASLAGLATAFVNLRIQGEEGRAVVNAFGLVMRFLPWGVAIAGAYAAAKAVRALSDAYSRAVDEAVEFANTQVEATNQVAAAIESTGGAAKRSVDDVAALASELQKVSNFGDETTLRAGSQLLTFTNVQGEEFDRALRAAADVSARLNRDLEGVAIQLGKALNDPILGLSALAESGIQFSESQKETIKTMVELGNVASAQRVILAELETQYAGSAKAAQEIRASIGNIQGDIKEAFGEGVIRSTNDALRRRAEILSDPIWSEFNNLIGRIAGAINAFGIELKNVALIITGGLLKAVRELYNGLKLIANLTLNPNHFLNEISEKTASNLERFGGGLETVAAGGERLHSAFAALQSSNSTESVMANLSAIADIIDQLAGQGRTFDELASLLNAATAEGSLDTSAATDALQKGLIGANELFDLLERKDLQGLKDLDLFAFSPEQLRDFELVVDGYEQAAENARAYMDAIKSGGEEAADAVLKQLEAEQEIERLVSEIPKQYRERARAALEAANADMQAAEQIAKSQERAADALKEELDLFKDLGRVLRGIENQKAQRLAGIERDQEGVRALIAAARLGEDEERMAREILNIRRQIKDISVEEARELAKQNIELEEQLDKIRRIREIAEQPFINAAAAIDSFWDRWIKGGENAVDILEDIFVNFFQDMAVAALRELFNPLVEGVQDAIKGDGGLGGLLDGLTGGLEKSFTKLGEAIGLSSTDGTAQAFGTAGASLGAGFAGLQLGKGLGSAIRPEANSTNQTVGGVIGGGIGAVIGGPIGAAIGAALGSLVGSLFGKASDNFARGIFDASQNQNIFTSSKGPENIQARSQFTDLLKTSVAAIGELTGAEFTRQLRFSVGSRDGIQLFRESGLSGDAGFRNQFRFFQGEDPTEAFKAAIEFLVDGLEGGTNSLVKFAQAQLDAGAAVESVIQDLEIISTALDFNREPLSEWQSLLKELNDVFDAAIEAANGVIEVERELIAEREKALALLRSDFADAVLQEQLTLQGSPLAGFSELAGLNATTRGDDIALNGSDALSEGLRALRFQKFFEQLLQSGVALDDINALFGDFEAIAIEAGASLDALTNGFDQALLSQISAFNEDIQNRIGGFLDSPLDDLERLLESQANRAKLAEQLGADIAEVERLSALELRDFFQGLSDQALEEVQGFLGLFEEATESIARNLDLSRQDLRGIADNFGNFAQEFAGLNADFEEQFLAASPRESLSVLRGRANELLAQVGQGNESAARALPQVLQDLVNNARTTFGNSQAFEDVLTFAQDTLKQAELDALAVQSDAERQISALDEGNSLLANIRDILQSGEAFSAFFESALGGGVATGDALLQLIQQGTGLTPSNDNAANVSIAGIFAQSLEPVVSPLTESLGVLSTQLEPLPALQSLTIDTIEATSARIVEAVDRVAERVNRLEDVEKKILGALEAA